MNAKNEMHKAKICMIMPYFGKWPEWFDLYLFSCSKVRKIDFYFFTDCALPSKYYENTKFIQMSFLDYCQLISDKLRINFHTQRPYKLCDMRPFYGLIHDDIAKQYEFWGFGDLDLVYGNMDMLINEENLAKYDLITAHATRIAGHFTIIRTDSKYTFVGTKIADWQEKLEDGEHNYGMDERYLTQKVKPSMRIMNAIYNRLLAKKIAVRSRKYYRCYQIMQNLLHFTTPKVLFKEGYTTLVPSPGEHWLYTGLPQTIINNNKQNGGVPYLHFLFFKKTPYLNTNDYWREGFYRIPANYSFKDDDVIDISLSGISLK